MKKELPRFTINRKPTVADPHGCYEYIGKDGKHYGYWYVGRNWAGERFVASADPTPEEAQTAGVELIMEGLAYLDSLDAGGPAPHWLDEVDARLGANLYA